MSNLTAMNLATINWNIDMLWLLLKVAYIIAASLFVGFGLVMLTQVKQMVVTIQRPFNRVIILIALGYMGLAAWNLLMSIVGL
jgi:hypothetical protein